MYLVFQIQLAICSIYLVQASAAQQKSERRKLWQTKDTAGNSLIQITLIACQHL